MLTFEKKNIKIEGEEIAYLDYGQGEPIVMVHGNMSSSVHYLPLIDRLKDKFRCIALDMRGFGDSSYNHEYNSMAELASDLNQFVMALGIEKAHFVCWSAGCPVTLTFAAAHPDKVKSIFAIEGGSHKGYPIFKKNSAFQSVYGSAYATKAEMASDPVQVAPAINMMAAKQAAQMSSLWDAVIYTVNKPTKEDGTVYIEETLKQRCLADLDWALATVNMSHENSAYTAGDGSIDKVTCPCVFTSGDKDLSVPSWMVMENINGIKNAKLLPYVNCGHSPLVDCPDKLTQDILQFVANI